MGSCNESTYLEELRPPLQYDRWDYVRALRALLPRGVLWNIPLPNEQNINSCHIQSEENFGLPTISG